MKLLNTNVETKHLSYHSLDGTPPSNNASLSSSQLSHNNKPNNAADDDQFKQDLQTSYDIPLQSVNSIPGYTDLSRPKLDHFTKGIIERANTQQVENSFKKTFTGLNVFDIIRYLTVPKTPDTLRPLVTDLRDAFRSHNTVDLLYFLYYFSKYGFYSTFESLPTQLTVGNGLQFIEAAISFRREQTISAQLHARCEKFGLDFKEFLNFVSRPAFQREVQENLNNYQELIKLWDQVAQECSPKQSTINTQGKKLLAARDLLQQIDFQGSTNNRIANGYKVCFYLRIPFLIYTINPITQILVRYTNISPIAGKITFSAACLANTISVWGSLQRARELQYDSTKRKRLLEAAASIIETLHNSRKREAGANIEIKDRYLAFLQAITKHSQQVNGDIWNARGTVSQACSYMFSALTGFTILAYSVYLLVRALFSMRTTTEELPSGYNMTDAAFMFMIMGFYALSNLLGTVGPLLSLAGSRLRHKWSRNLTEERNKNRTFINIFQAAEKKPEKIQELKKCPGYADLIKRIEVKDKDITNDANYLNRNLKKISNEVSLDYCSAEFDQSAYWLLYTLQAQRSRKSDTSKPNGGSTSTEVLTIRTDSNTSAGKHDYEQIPEDLSAWEILERLGIDNSLIEFIRNQTLDDGVEILKNLFAIKT